MLVAACGATESVRTADPFRRGWTEADFPRVQELAPGVYSYEQLRAAGEELFTTVSLFVVTDAGVLVADGQAALRRPPGWSPKSERSPGSRSPTW